MCNIKYAQLNSDVFTGVVDFGWDQIVEEYRRAKQVEGLQEASIYETRLTLRHFDRSTITTQNRKAGKAMAERPIPEEIMTELSNHITTLPDGQERLFGDRFSPKLWKKAWKAAGLPRVKFHDLRKTFASLLAQRGVSTAVTQRLLEHSTPQLTNDVYTNVDPVLRQAISQLPVAEWV